MSLLRVVVSQTKFEYASGAQFFHSLVHLYGNFVVVFVGLIAETENLSTLEFNS